MTKSYAVRRNIIQTTPPDTGENVTCLFQSMLLGTYMEGHIYRYVKLTYMSFEFPNIFLN